MDINASHDITAIIRNNKTRLDVYHSILDLKNCFITNDVTFLSFSKETIFLF